MPKIIDADVATYDGFIRGSARQLVQMIKTIDPGTWNQFATDNVDAQLTAAADDDVVPQSTSHAGAKDLTAKEFKELQTLARSILSQVQAKWSLLIKAAGPGN